MGDPVGHVKARGYEAEECLGVIRKPEVVRIEEQDGRAFRYPYAMVSRLARSYATGLYDAYVRVDGTDSLRCAVDGTIIYQDDL